MRASDVELEFPVLGFTTDGDFWGFPDRRSLAACGPHTLKENLQIGMELIDAIERRWVVRAVQVVRKRRSLSSLLLYPEFIIDQELEPLEPISLDEVKARVRRNYETHPDWAFLEDDERAEDIASAESAVSIADLYAKRLPDTFEGA